MKSVVGLAVVALLAGGCAVYAEPYPYYPYYPGAAHWCLT
jgi:hypothetical protein